MIRKLLAPLLALLVAAPLNAAELARVSVQNAEGPVKPVSSIQLATPLSAPSLATLPQLDAVNETALPELPKPLTDVSAANDPGFAAPLSAAQQVEAAAAPDLQSSAKLAAQFDGIKPAAGDAIVPVLREQPKTAPRWRSVALAVMAAGSLNLSRTTTVGRKWFAPQRMTNAQVAEKAEKNFRKAALLVVDHAKELPLSRDTAIRLNKILTDGLVPDDIKGNPDYHTDTRVFYAWLASPEVQRLADADPVGLANQLHYKMSRLDSFPDGNGRLARLMADLALIRRGYAPVFYSDMADYFARGNHRSKVDHAARRAYFREMAARGQRAVEDPGWLKDELKRINGLSRATVAAVTANEGHAGTAAFSRKALRAQAKD